MRDSRRRARALRRMREMRRAIKRIDDDLDIAKVRIQANKAKIDDHEARIVALEP